MKCAVCSRDVAEDSYCKQHEKAFENIKAKYELWKKAMDISWKEYLSEIANNPLTGEWAREVAHHLLENEEK